MEDVIRSPLLVLDDVGLTRPSPWIEDIMFQIINGRYNTKGQMIISTNYSLKKLGPRIGERVTERLAEVCRVIEVTGENRRKRR